MRLTEQQKRVINENPHLQAGKLAKFLGVSVNTIGSYRKRSMKRKWTYTGVGIPFLKFCKINAKFYVRHKMMYIFSGTFQNAINHQGQLLWLLDRGLCPFGLDEKPVLEVNYFENLKL